jgi:predicted transposase/invertase (TIGR01784 family)
MKRILRDKANYAVLEGFLSVLLKEKVLIETILSSQSNQDTHDDKYNDVDILVRNSKGEYLIIEVQNTKQNDYFHRILFGSSKVITEYIQSGAPYENVKKVYSITVAYFDLGQGLDYVYHGTTSFKGIHRGDILTLSTAQRERYEKLKIHEIYPEYWIIKAGIFDENQVQDELDEWIYFFKTGCVLADFSAAGLDLAKKLLDKLNLPKSERSEYNEYEERLRKLASYQLTEMQEVQDLVKSAVAEKAIEMTLEKEQAIAEKELEKEQMLVGMAAVGISPSQMALIANKTEAEVLAILAKYKK